MNGQNDTRRQGQEQNQKGRSGLGPNWSRLVWVILAIAIAALIWNQFQPGSDSAQISYSTFRQQVQDDNVAEVTLSGTSVEGRFREPTVVEGADAADSEQVARETFVTYVPAIGDESLLDLLEEHDVIVQTEPESSFSILAIATSVLPFLLLLGVGYYLLRRAQGSQQGIFSMGRSRAKLYDRTQEQTTFSDVAGLAGAKAELQEIIEYLKNPDKVTRLGGNAPNGVLLVGPPGTGKTLLARAAAGEANVPFFSITGSDFMEMFVGVGASRVRSLFEEARQASPCIVFIDELDSIGRRRGAGLGGGHDEREQTLNQLLSELDGFEPTEDVVVMAATNRPDILDPALLRPGRFDRQVIVDLPTTSAREDILQIHARNKPLAADVDLARLARATPGFSGADLENILNEAALLAARRDQEAIRWQDIEDARDKVMMGLVREGLLLTDQELQLLAFHEAGHALVAAILPNADPIHKVTIVPRGRAMGVTQQLPEQEKYIYPREYLVDRLAVILGGRAAEALVLDTTTSGAENDLKEATRLARKMVLDWGMAENFEHIALGGEREQVFLGEEISQRRHYSEATAREADKAIKELLDSAFSLASKTLAEHRPQLKELAETLLDKEVVTGDEVVRIVRESKKESRATAYSN
ncbi:MAG: ATP-dependent zinc metalloprotease FtsH [Candidatus Promineifilaceae bacterium]